MMIDVSPFIRLNTGVEDDAATSSSCTLVCACGARQTLTAEGPQEALGRIFAASPWELEVDGRFLGAGQMAGACPACVQAQISRGDVRIR